MFPKTYKWIRPVYHSVAGLPHVQDYPDRDVRARSSFRTRITTACPCPQCAALIISYQDDHCLPLPTIAAGQFRMPQGKWNAYDNDLRIPWVIRSDVFFNNTGGP